MLSPFTPNGIMPAGPVKDPRTGLSTGPRLPKSIKAKEKLRQREAMERRKKKWWYRFYLFLKGGKK